MSEWRKRGLRRGIEVRRRFGQVAQNPRCKDYV